MLIRKIRLTIPARAAAFLGLFLIVSAQAQAPQTIRLTVDYNDGVRKSFVLPFRSGMTVFDAMTAAQNHPHGIKFYCDPKFPCDGAPANRLLSQIDDLKNQRGGANAKEWLFWVNNVFSDKGFGVCTIAANDQVIWKFDTYHGQKPGKACR
jgi:hypothetical protein